MSELHSWARLLGGKVSGGQVLCPGPGHTADDLSLSVKIGRDALIVKADRRDALVVLPLRLVAEVATAAERAKS
jgi:hypothetical protein